MLVPYILFNLFLAVGLRDLVARILAHKRIREVAFLLLVICAALPQLLCCAARWAAKGLRAFFARFLDRLALDRDGESDPAQRTYRSPSPILLAWTLAAAIFSCWQFTDILVLRCRGRLRYRSPSSRRDGLVERFFRLPSLLFRDPLAALIEKEIRFLVRSPRFRLVFLMGFTFGLVIWLPMALGRSGRRVDSGHELSHRGQRVLAAAAE